MRFANTRHASEGGFEPSVPAKHRSLRRKSAAPAQWKAQQLCAQVRQVLEMSLAEFGNDPLLESVFLVSVEPAPNASRLCVTVTADSEEGPVDVPAILDALCELRPMLRREISEEINRKKTPMLVFQFVPPPSM